MGTMGWEGESTVRIKTGMTTNESTYQVYTTNINMGEQANANTIYVQQTFENNNQFRFHWDICQ
jgi:hypothetical protein